MNSHTFIDLRANQRHDQGNEGFWPSFTDIMTTIVMIFLIALVVLLARNLELVQQLRSTMEAERIASELAHTTGAQKDLLAAALHAAEARLQKLSAEVRTLHTQDRARMAQITQQQASITALQQARTQFKQEIADLIVLREQLQTEVAQYKAQIQRANLALQQREVALQTAQADNSVLRTDLEKTQANLVLAQEQRQQTQNQLASVQQQLTARDADTAAVEQQYATLVADYAHLKTKYDKLIRPARSVRGRHRVEVRYWKRDGMYKIAWREGTTGRFQTVERTELETILADLDQQHSQGLYIRVVLPDDSDLSHSEAWQFTLYLHQRYDYYYKKQ